MAKQLGIQALKYNNWMKPGKWNSCKYQTATAVVY